jgi:hypothetical protein
MESIFAFSVDRSHLIPATISISFAWPCFSQKENAITVGNKQIDCIIVKNAIFMFARIACANHWSHSLWKSIILLSNREKWLLKKLVRAIRRSVNRQMICYDKLDWTFILIMIKVLVFKFIAHLGIIKDEIICLSKLKLDKF